MRKDHKSSAGVERARRRASPCTRAMAAATWSCAAAAFSASRRARAAAGSSSTTGSGGFSDKAGAAAAAKGLDLAEYFITSKAEKINSDDQVNFKIEVKKTNGTKCNRCWKILEKNCIRCEKAILRN